MNTASTRVRLLIAALFATLLVTLPAAAQEAPPPIPSFEALEAAGATVGEIRIVTQDIFDTADPQENRLLFRWANALHVQTRPGVIRSALLFSSGQKLSLRAIEETERLLRGYRFLYDVQFRPVAYRNGVVDIEVLTRDTWTFEPSVSVGRTGGTNSSSVGFREDNVLGTGISIGVDRSKSVDRSGTQFQIANERTFGTWTSASYSLASNSDGRREAVAVVRPFYALDARWAGGASASKDSRTDAVYNAGNVVSQYRRRETRAEAFGGWSAGLVDGWVRRWSLGLSVQDDGFAAEPGLTPPPELPADRRLVGPFVRYQLVEDRYDRELNRNLIGRPEFFALGLNTTLQVGYASTGLGSSVNTWLYAGTVSRGFEPASKHLLVAGATLSGQVADGRLMRQRLGLQAQYYLPQGRRWLFYAGASADLLTRPDPTQMLQLGGDNGLRGYPLRYQGGTRRALLTVEQRFYTDLYLWRLFRVGGAAFIDVGRAWGGTGGGYTNTTNPGWLADAGVGLRIVNSRTAFASVLHIDIAAPVNTAPGVKGLQLLVKTKASF